MLDDLDSFIRAHGSEYSDDGALAVAFNERRWKDVRIGELQSLSMLTGADTFIASVLSGAIAADEQVKATARRFLNLATIKTDDIRCTIPEVRNAYLDAVRILADAGMPGRDRFVDLAINPHFAAVVELDVNDRRRAVTNLDAVDAAYHRARVAADAGNDWDHIVAAFADRT